MYQSIPVNQRAPCCLLTTRNSMLPAFCNSWCIPPSGSGGLHSILSPNTYPGGVGLCLAERVIPVESFPPAWPFTTFCSTHTLQTCLKELPGAQAAPALLGGVVSSTVYPKPAELLRCGQDINYRTCYPMLESALCGCIASCAVEGLELGTRVPAGADLGVLEPVWWC